MRGRGGIQRENEITGEYDIGGSVESAMDDATLWHSRDCCRNTCAIGDCFEQCRHRRELSEAPSISLYRSSMSRPYSSGGSAGLETTMCRTRMRAVKSSP